MDILNMMSNLLHDEVLKKINKKPPVRKVKRYQTSSSKVEDIKERQRRNRIRYANGKVGDGTTSVENTPYLFDDATRCFLGRDYKVVCLVGALRNKEIMDAYAAKRHLDGDLVLIPHKIDEEQEFICLGTVPDDEGLIDLYKKYISIADEVVCVSREGYIGETTQADIEWAEKMGKEVQYFDYDDLDVIEDAEVYSIEDLDIVETEEKEEFTAIAIGSTMTVLTDVMLDLDDIAHAKISGIGDTCYARNRSAINEWKPGDQFYCTHCEIPEYMGMVPSEGRKCVMLPYTTEPKEGWLLWRRTQEETSMDDECIQVVPALFKDLEQVEKYFNLVTNIEPVEEPKETFDPKVRPLVHPIETVHPIKDQIKIDQKMALIPDQIRAASIYGMDEDVEICSEINFFDAVYQCEYVTIPSVLDIEMRERPAREGWVVYRWKVNEETKKSQLGIVPFIFDTREEVREYFRDDDQADTTNDMNRKEIIEEDITPSDAEDVEAKANKFIGYFDNLDTLERVPGVCAGEICYVEDHGMYQCIGNRVDDPDNTGKWIWISPIPARVCKAKQDLKFTVPDYDSKCDVQLTMDDLAHIIVHTEEDFVVFGYLLEVEDGEQDLYYAHAVVKQHHGYTGNMKSCKDGFVVFRRTLDNHIALLPRLYFTKAALQNHFELLEK